MREKRGKAFADAGNKKSLEDIPPAWDEMRKYGSPWELLARKKF